MKTLQIGHRLILGKPGVELHFDDEWILAAHPAGQVWYRAIIVMGLCPEQIDIRKVAAIASAVTNKALASLLVLVKNEGEGLGSEVLRAGTEPITEMDQ